MPTITDSLSADTSRYQSVEIPVGGTNLPPLNEGQPTINPYLRCPLPPISVTPDSLRQYYVGGQIPQFRILTPPNSILGSGGGTIIKQTFAATTVGTGTIGPAPAPSTGLVATSVSLTTPVLNNGDVYLGTIPISKSFQLLNVTANGQCRIEIYGTPLVQTQDAGRGIDVAPLPGTTQNLITDVVLDTVPYQWSWQNRIGSNADSPQNVAAYITITNIGVVSLALTITLVYIPLEG
jgi:hypothetical protein